MAEIRLPSSDMAALDQLFWQQMERERATFVANHTADAGSADHGAAPASSGTGDNARQPASGAASPN